MFGLRMQRGSSDYFTDALVALHPSETSDTARIEAEFGRTLVIHLSRPDKLDQAISRVRAEQTGLWHRNADGSELERLAPPAEPRYDSAAITRHVAELTEMDAAWNAWFAREGIEPLRVAYDELSNDPRAALARVLKALGLGPQRAAQVAMPTAKLADAISGEWRARFLNEGRGRD